MAPVYHIVLFKLKPNVKESEIDELKEALTGMVGKVPGLIRADIAPPHISTAHRSQGFNMGLVAVLDGPETIKTYGEHPEHQKVHKIREALCDDTLAYDLEYNV
ncbi:hypothetical protein AYL99_11027 [Fonsecaea erecta]|uniref:Stress-response A/B barrel domain-containing protein n=1 Tax=Fonsecaea erecta TaxID=1367422 RepID=A0A178Z4B2_9EURO|nr:hypothetical protein AYL99_11027 [Fonsecaea erecta]OAP54579.1 hypothetical protein AYL99_11027 [Fonsecaea erecta]